MSDYAKAFIFGGISGCGATVCVHPLDVIRVQIQITSGGGENLTSVTKRILAEKGPAGLYAGLTAGLFRQVTYGLTRFGIYNVLSDGYVRDHKKQPSFGYKLLYGCAAGGIGAVVGNPSEVALVRMSADSKAPPAERRNYKNAGNALARIVKEEGFSILFRGLDSNVARCVLLNAAQLATFAQSKELIVSQTGMAEGVGLQFAASMVAGLAATIVTLPMDTTKSRLQNMKVNSLGILPYSSAMDCVLKSVKNEGVFSLWKGFFPFYIKLAPHTTISLIILDQLRLRF
jgi:solute carrier family 25 oxoglutarate transporter 11